MPTRFGNKNRETHGMSGTRLYRIWKSMRTRCMDKNAKAYENYGGRGITICSDWDDFMKFYRWAIESGYDENAERGECTLDRIDVNGNYCPENCRWVSMKEQFNNKQHHYMLTFSGKTMNLAQWSKAYGIRRETLRSRLENGWDVEKALTHPVRH